MGATDDLANALAASGMLTVDVERLLEFANGMWTEFEAFGVAMDQEVLSPMGDMLVNFAGGGLAEGFEFQEPYARCQQALGMFLAETWLGLATLSAGATTVGVRYATGDRDAAGLIAAVSEAFAPATDAELARAAAKLAPGGDENLRDGASAIERFDATVETQRGYIEEHREDVLSGDTDMVFPSSDHDDDELVLHADGELIVNRGVAGTGNGAILIERDDENVNNVRVAGPGGTAIDDLDLSVHPADLPVDIQRGMAEVRSAWHSDDLPGTRHD